MSAVESSTPSTRPYLIRALHEWCQDHGFSPYIAVQVDASVQVPREFVQNDEIVLNVSADATSGLRLGNDYIEFKARFAGVARDIMVPVTHVLAIYARENGQGMAFAAPPKSGVPVPDVVGRGAASLGSVTGGGGGDEPPLSPPPSGNKPQLKRVK